MAVEDGSVIPGGLISDAAGDGCEIAWFRREVYAGRVVDIEPRPAMPEQAPLTPACYAVAALN